jgi:hypothetical protein
VRAQQAQALEEEAAAALGPEAARALEEAEALGPAAEAPVAAARVTRLGVSG